MKVIVCGSMTASKEMVKAEEALIKAGHDVVLPEGTLEFIASNKSETSTEAIANKAHGDLIRDYFNKIKLSDAVLIVNDRKNGINGYIGGNVFLEIGFAHVLGKNVYLLNPLPEVSPYLDELKAINPIVINGDYSLIK